MNSHQVTVTCWPYLESVHRQGHHLARSSSSRGRRSVAHAGAPLLIGSDRFQPRYTAGPKCAFTWLAMEGRAESDCPKQRRAGLPIQLLLLFLYYMLILLYCSIKLFRYHIITLLYHYNIISASYPIIILNYSVIILRYHYTTMRSYYHMTILHYYIIILS